MLILGVLKRLTAWIDIGCKLKNKKTLYVKVRAYKLNGKKKIYGKWSKVKKVKKNNYFDKKGKCLKNFSIS
ncbi:MAG: hypothetical protein HFG29_07880 [Eubacterium sp.]|nr:hypothetical protein [Eubacterium sp.]